MALFGFQSKCPDNAAHGTICAADTAIELRGCFGGTEAKWLNKRKKIFSSNLYPLV